MSRFFNPQEGSGWFGRENMFRPDFAAFEHMLSNNQKQIDTQREENEALRQALALEYAKDLDTGNMQEYQDYWNNEINNVASEMQNDLLDYTKNQKMINSLRERLGKDILVGEGSRMLETAKNYNQFLKDTEKLPAHLKDRYREFAKEKFLQETEGQASKKGIFKGVSTIDDIDLTQDFLKSEYFNKLKPDAHSKITRDTNGKFWIEKGDTREELTKEKIETAFRDYLANNTDRLGAYAKDRTDIFGRNDMLDSQGNLRMDENSWIGKSLDNIKTYAWEKVSEVNKKSYDELYAHNAKANADDARAKRNAREQQKDKQYTSEVHDQLWKTPQGMAKAKQLFSRELGVLANFIPEQTLRNLVTKNGGRIPNDLKQNMNGVLNNYLQNGTEEQRKKAGEALAALNQIEQERQEFPVLTLKNFDYNFKSPAGDNVTAEQYFNDPKVKQELWGKIINLPKGISLFSANDEGVQSNTQNASVQGLIANKYKFKSNDADFAKYNGMVYKDIQPDYAGSFYPISTGDPYSAEDVSYDSYAKADLDSGNKRKTEKVRTGIEGGMAVPVFVTLEHPTQKDAEGNPKTVTIQQMMYVTEPVITTYQKTY